MTEGLTQRAPPPPPGRLFITVITVIMVIIVIIIATIVITVIIIIIIMTTSARLAVQQVEAEKHLVMVREKNTTQVSEFLSQRNTTHNQS